MQVAALWTAEGSAMKWVARTGSVIVVLINGLALLFIVDGGEGRGGQPPPLFGLFIACLALSVIGALLAFRWARPAARILIAAGILQLFLWLRWQTAWGHVFVFVVPSIALGAVLLALRPRRRMRS